MTDKYFYYTADQINSTRVVTDDSGNVVYSATYSPFGKKIQSSQTIDDSPKPQFSNKEREQTTNLDYFGARYYDHATYRFNSTDPIINKKEAIANPQLWNLYAYCRNNPVTYLDPDGRDSILGIHSDAQIDAAFDFGHAWISVRNLDTNTFHTYGLFPGGDMKRFEIAFSASGRVYQDVEIKNHKKAEYSRYFYLDESKEKKLEAFIAIPDKWTSWHTCADWASDAVRVATGEDVDADDYFGFETPREISRNIDEYNKRNN